MHALTKLRGYLAARAAAGDMPLLRWALLGVAVPVCVLALHACGAVEALNLAQLEMLAGHPFYLSAEDAQVSLLTPVGSFALCVLLVLYMGAVLLREPRLMRRSHLCLLAALAVGLPGLMCVLWHGVLYVAELLLSILLLWVIVVPLAQIRRMI